MTFFTHLKRNGTGKTVEKYLDDKGILPRDVFIVRQESPCGYLVFNSPEEFFRKHGPGKAAPQYFHEILTQGPQRLRIDVDASADTLTRIIPASEHSFDIPSDLRQYLTSTNATFRTICEAIVEAMCNVYLHHYGADPTICVCESVDKDRKKYSRHFIVVGASVSTSTQAHEYAKEVTASLPIQYRRFIDLDVYKTVQSFRIAGSTKYGQTRVKKIMTPHKPIDTLLRAASDDVVLDDILIDSPVPSCISDENTDKIIEICAAAGLLKHHSVRKERRGNMLVFNRNGPSHCDICNRTHTADNTLIVTTQPIGDGVVAVYQHCRKQRGITTKIGTYVTAGATNNIATIEKTEWLKKKISTTPETLQDDLFADCKGIEYAEPALREFEPDDTLVVHAAMKMGKTKMLRNYIAKHFPESKIQPPVIRFISFRQTFASNIKDNFKDFTLYSDVRAGSVLNQPRLIIQVESLYRLVIDEGPPDLLILDESESILEQFDSGLLRAANVTISKFIYLLQHSRRVICMDANITSRTENVLRNIRKRPITYHHNTWQNARDSNVYIVPEKARWLALINQAVAEGEKIAVPMSSIEEATALHRLIESRYPAIGSVIYSSETSQAVKREHFADVNEHWTRYNVVIYTPTVSAGVSFEQKHFDKVFGYFTDKSCNDTTCIQMLGRIRDIGDKTTFIYIDANGEYDLPTNEDDIREQFYGRRKMLFADAGYNGLYAEYNAEGQITYHTTPYFTIWLENTRARNLSRNNFMQRMITMLKSTGAHVAPLNDELFRGYTAIDMKTEDGVMMLEEIATEHDGEKKQSRYEKSSAVAQANEIDYDRASQILGDMLKQKDVPAEDVLEYKKYTLREAYNFHNEIDSEFVAKYSKPAVRQQYKNVCAIGKGTDEDLARIQSQERAVYNLVMNADDDLQVGDISKKYNYNKHRIAVKLARACGWTRLESTWVHMGTVEQSVGEDTDSVRTLIRSALQEYDFGKLPVPNDAESLARMLLTVTGRALKLMYGIAIVSDRADKKMKTLKMSPLFTTNRHDRTRPLVRVPATEVAEYEDV